MPFYCVLNLLFEVLKVIKEVQNPTLTKIGLRRAHTFLFVVKPILQSKNLHKSNTSCKLSSPQLQFLTYYSIAVINDLTIRLVLIREGKIRSQRDAAQVELLDSS